MSVGSSDVDGTIVDGVRTAEVELGGGWPGKKKKVFSSIFFLSENGSDLPGYQIDARSIRIKLKDSSFVTQNEQKGAF